ncbi:MAG: hypothetical protein GY943_07410 [Chloroflexi bacterium]|nr:hypothetical protein [Chloroflexota bacterium]
MKKTTLLLTLITLLITACSTDSSSSQQVDIVVAPDAGNQPEAGSTGVPTPAFELPTPISNLPTAVPYNITTTLQEEAVFTNESVATWTATYLRPGPMVMHNGQFHMFFLGSDGATADIGMAYATSPDGTTWTIRSDEPVFTISAEMVDYAAVTIVPASVIVEPNGTWILYFTAVSEIVPQRASISRIGRATAPSPIGPWTLDPTPVLDIGSEGSWDSHAIRNPSVWQTDNGYTLFYGGTDVGIGGEPGFGMATSPDGINWTKYDDPETTDGRFVESDPVFVFTLPGDLTTQNGVDPNVVQTDDGWVMAFQIFNLIGLQTTLGFAHSPDGIHWTPMNDNAPLSTEGRSDWYRIYDLSFVANDDTYYAYFNVQSLRLFDTDIYLTTFDLP